MGLLRDMLHKLNLRSGAAASPVLSDPGFARAERSAAKGGADSARIVGVEQRLNDGTTKRYIAVAVATVSGTERAGIEVTGPVHVLARLRPGVEVLVRHRDGDAVVLDWAALCARWGVEADPSQKRRRKAPDDGVKDGAVDWAVQKRLGKWTPRRATITALTQRAGALGGMTLNFDVALRLDDGAQAVAANTEIPFYAAWLAAPGAVVPVCVDPSDPAKAVVDWAAAANEPGRAPGMLDDRPPAGSAAELLG
jgi:hypothetical protein